jgi:hypothetical protein
MMTKFGNSDTSLRKRLTAQAQKGRAKGEQAGKKVKGWKSWSQKPGDSGKNNQIKRTGKGPSWNPEKGLNLNKGGNKGNRGPSKAGQPKGKGGWWYGGKRKGK